jgi:hypothetical protein
MKRRGVQNEPIEAIWTAMDVVVCVHSHHQVAVCFNYLHTEQETKSITLLVSPQFFHILVATHDEFLIVTLEFGAAGVVVNLFQLCC